MATMRISPTEVQLNATIYTFADPDIADAFEACVATVNIKYCEQEHPAVSKRIADANYRDA